MFAWMFPMSAFVPTETHIKKSFSQTDITGISVTLRVTEKSNSPALPIKTPEFLVLCEMQKKTLLRSERPIPSISRHWESVIRYSCKQVSLCGELLVWRVPYKFKCCYCYKVRGTCNSVYLVFLGNAQPENF